ncbi:hypothetical protein Sjap_000129 [Stephania japonica]|uniref:Uncharacterized protein n=1 Tax=Stephania japonica TaxID=461633 RepID=A0AAP0PS64_9MAGN
MATQNKLKFLSLTIFALKLKLPICCGHLRDRDFIVKLIVVVQVVGLGISGRAAARLALIRGASVIAIDRNENLVPLEDDLDFGKYGNLKTILGSFDRKVLENADRVVVSPGVPFENHDLSLLW